MLCTATERWQLHPTILHLLKILQNGFVLNIHKNVLLDIHYHAIVHPFIILLVKKLEFISFEMCANNDLNSINFLDGNSKSNKHNNINNKLETGQHIDILTSWAQFYKFISHLESSFFFRKVVRNIVASVFWTKSWTSACIVSHNASATKVSHRCIIDPMLFM